MQATLADAVARRARREAAESASVASAVEMERASAEVPRAELFEKTQARMEELTAQHYRKYADIMAEAPKGQQVNAVARRETGCDEGALLGRPRKGAAQASPCRPCRARLCIAPC